MTPYAARAWARDVGLKLRYGADLHKLAPLGAPFVQLDVDRGTAQYLEHAEAHRHGRLITMLHRSLRGFLSDFDINGLLGTYPMHVLSTAQWRELLGADAGGDLLDIGAGRGDVTAQLAPVFDQVLVTETSRTMQRRLKRLGYALVTEDLETLARHRRFDAVSLLNVLDRCDRPLSLLGTARTLIKSGGLLVLALVLPYHPFVYDGGVARAPNERLPIQSSDFETAAVEFASLALEALGLRVQCLSRAPYFSGGDAKHPIYELDDLIVVCRAHGDPPPILGASP